MLDNLFQFVWNFLSVGLVPTDAHALKRGDVIYDTQISPTNRSWVLKVVTTVVVVPCDEYHSPYDESQPFDLPLTNRLVLVEP